MSKSICNFVGQLSQIKLLSLDVDGVLTDGGIYYSDDGKSFRKFNAKDGLGISRLLNNGIEIAIISAGASGAIQYRAQRLNIKYVYTDVIDKLAVLKDLCKTLNIEISHVAHIGDDLNDIEVFKEVGLSITVSDAVGSVLSSADIITKRKGGEGAVREVCDAMLKN